MPATACGTQALPVKISLTERLHAPTLSRLFAVLDAVQQFFQ